MEAMEEGENKDAQPHKVRHQTWEGLRMEQQPQRLLPGSTQSDTMQCIKQRLFYTAAVHRL